jgi:beta-phosphoglucomutase
MGTSGQRQGRAGRPHSPPHDLRACGVTTERRGNRVLKAILWDMDGVVADTEEAHLLAWRQFLAEQGRSVTAEQFATTFGMANPAILRQWFGDALRAEDIHSWSARKEALFRTFVPTHVRALPGAREWLRWGRERGYRQAIASSGEMANIVAVVAALEIGNQFDALVSGAFLPRSKPDPAVFLQGAAALGVAPEECLVVEDGIVGVEAARRAGMRCLALTTTHPAEKLAGADLIVHDLNALSEELVDALFA